MKRIVAILLMLAMLVAVSCASGKVAAPKKQDMFMGGSSAASGMHMATIALAHLWNKYVPEVNITPVEAKGSVEQSFSLEDGRFQLAGYPSISLSVVKEMYKIKPFDERPVYNGWRALFKITSASNWYTFVNADSDIYSYSDLEGKKFSHGLRGSGTAATHEIALDIIGVKPEYWWGSVAEGAAALKEGRIDAWYRTGSGKQLDATALEVSFAIPIRIISLTPEEEAKFLAVRGTELPTTTVRTIPAGAIIAMPDAGELKVFGPAGSQGSSTVKGVISQEIGYKLVKALAENYSDLWVVHRGAEELAKEFGGDPIKGTIALVLDEHEAFNPKFQEFYPGYSIYPFHPGAVQYFKEMGYDVPEVLIPPEYEE